MEKKSTITNESIERTVAAYSDTLLRLAMHYTKSLADAQDIVQGVFLQLVRKRQAFDGDAHEKAWLLRCTVNACKNWLGSAWRRGAIPLDERLLPAEKAAEPDSVMDLVRLLPAPERAAIYLYYYERYSVADIAAMLGEPEGTVSSRLHRARKRLGAMLKGDTDD